ncbi:CCA tRNA nucleotidyltransferase [Oceanobacillus halotolerans]|uniref:CCA tRNA nucleotidyltransferase n=1 Tax=Oceanobacillus halotolerans TaxID=2663380 RepID=UPI0013DB6879|nr:CCA tRNA nucleotidyltransferase [Oceanobacillus halotolerans]
MEAPFKDAINIIEQIEEHGYEAFFVGGCVRDSLLDKKIGDIDIATSAKPHTIQSIFDDVIPVGIEHGTVIVRLKGESYEVTTYRVDGDYSDQRHPDHVQFISSIDQDLQRRDFTINALAMDKHGKILDLFNGKKDLQQQLIRTVGNGHERFTEDPLRIIRALRFASQLSFVIEEKTLAAMVQVAPQIRTIAVERITTEIIKLFAGGDVLRGFTYIKKTGVHHYLPVIQEHPSIIKQIPSSLVPLQSFGEIIALLHYIEKTVPIKTWIKEWKASKRNKQEAMELVEALTYFETTGLNSWLLYRLPKAYYAGFIRLTNSLWENSLTVEEIHEEAQQLPIQSRNELAINGLEIQQLFPEKEKGPWIRNLLNQMEKEVVMGNVINSKQELREWIRWNPPEIN